MASTLVTSPLHQCDGSPAQSSSTGELMPRGTTPLSMAACLAAAVEWRRQRMEIAQRRESVARHAISLVTTGERTDTESYNAALAGCRHTGQPSQALAIWEQMRERGVAAHTMSYQHAIVCAMQLDRYALALEIWYQLEKDSSARPTLVDYTAAMSASERLGRPEGALQLYDAMQAAGIVPDSNAMHVVVIAAGGAARPERASEVLSRIEFLGVRPSTALYNSAMHACLATHDWHLASRLFVRMHRVCTPEPDPSTPWL